MHLDGLSLCLAGGGGWLFGWVVLAGTYNSCDVVAASPAAKWVILECRLFRRGRRAVCGMPHFFISLPAVKQVCVCVCAIVWQLRYTRTGSSSIFFCFLGYFVDIIKSTCVNFLQMYGKYFVISFRGCCWFPSRTLARLHPRHAATSPARSSPPLFPLLRLQRLLYHLLFRLSPLSLRFRWRSL